MQGSTQLTSRTATEIPHGDAPISIRSGPGDFYGQAALAAALGINERTVQRWRRRGRGKFPKPFLFRGRPCWSGAAIARWLNTQQEEVL